MADPQRVGRYLIKQVLGHGGMGTVYLAEDPLLKRRVAIKVVKAFGEAREHAMLRFKREAEISAQLNHPNVVTVYDVGIEPDIGPFLAMEYVEGKNLAQHIKGKSLDLETSVRVLIQAGRALRAAHRMAIIHRDVKPENILLSEEGRAKLMDFGIARSFTHASMGPEPAPFGPEHLLESRSVDVAGTNPPPVTTTGDLPRPPAYAPPEVLKGADASPNSDRYSFCATAFELLTGKLPHPGSSLTGIISHILKEPPLTPPDMSPTVGRVFHRALAPDPDERYPALVDFFEELIDALPLQAGAKARLFATLNQTEDGDMMASRRTSPFPVMAPQPPKPMMSGPARPKRIDLDDPPSQPNRSQATQRMVVQPRVQPVPFPWKAWVKGILVAIGLIYGLQWLLPRINRPPRTLNVTTNPSGAKVFVDGLYVGETPLLGVRIAGHAQNLLIQREGFNDVIKLLQPTDQDVQVALERPGQAISVESDPPGAKVTINGMLMGRTPIKALPTVDPHSELVVSMEGYKPFITRMDAGIPRPVVLEKMGGN